MKIKNTNGLTNEEILHYASLGLITPQDVPFIDIIKESRSEANWSGYRKGWEDGYAEGYAEGIDDGKELI